jgi:hypothetical protein
MPSGHLMGLPLVSAADFRSPQLPFDLDPFTAERVHPRPRSRDLPRPRSSCCRRQADRCRRAGRYAALLTAGTVAYNESIHGGVLPRPRRGARQGVCCGDELGPRRPPIAYIGGTVGVKQTESRNCPTWKRIRLPRLERANRRDARKPSPRSPTRWPQSRTARGRGHAPRLDELVAERSADRPRSRVAGRPRTVGPRDLFRNTGRAPSDGTGRPSSAEVGTYAENLCNAFNAFASDDGGLGARADRYSALQGDLLVVRFRLAERGAAARTRFTISLDCQSWARLRSTRSEETELAVSQAREEPGGSTQTMRLHAEGLRTIVISPRRRAIGR